MYCMYCHKEQGTMLFHSASGQIAYLACQKCLQTNPPPLFIDENTIPTVSDCFDDIIRSLLLSEDDTE